METEFRGKRKDNGEWVYGFYAYSKEFDKHYIYCEELVHGFYGLIPHEVIPETIGQYIGLKDKNNKKIFTNNVCYFKRLDANIIIQYSACRVGYTYSALGDNNSYYVNRGMSEFSEGVSEKQLEIIGDVFDMAEEKKD